MLKEEQGIQVKKKKYIYIYIYIYLPQKKEVRKEIKQQQKQEYSSWITSFLKLFSVEFQEVEKGNLQIKENMEEWERKGYETRVYWDKGCIDTKALNSCETSGA